MTKNGAELFAGDEEGILRLFDIHTRKLTKDFGKIASMIFCLKLTPSEEFLLAGCSGGLFIRINRKEGFEERKFKNVMPDNILCLAVSASGKSVLMGDWSGNLKEWLVEAEQMGKDFGTPHSDRIRDIKISSDEQFFFTCSADKTVKKFSMEEKKMI